MDTADDSVIRRALAFAETLKWEAPTVTRVEPPDDDVVATYGTPGHANYLAVTIEMRWSPKSRDAILAQAPDEERKNAERILATPIVLCIVCTSTDVIHHYFPGTDPDE
jgi:hypothetical protein